MAYNPKIHRRRSIRLDGYDYSARGAYFVTLCVQDRRCVFGKVSDGQMHLNEQGQLIDRIWREIPQHYPGVSVDRWVIMPNHLHGVVWIGARPRADQSEVETGLGNARVAEIGRTRGQGGAAPTEMQFDPTPSQSGASTDGSGRTRGSAPTGLSNIVQRFKSFTTKLYGDGVRSANWPPFDGRLWQRDYFEHVVRDNESLDLIHHYVATNPERWSRDMDNPDGDGSDDVEQFAQSLSPVTRKVNEIFPDFNLQLDQSL
ncbi:MAG TPA: transposase [Tepidisphaeraceae bacterium]|jgi:REP element-mobilizing transposase RayT